MLLALALSGDVPPASAPLKPASPKAAWLESQHVLIGKTKEFEKLVITCPSLRGSASTESCIRDHVEHLAVQSAFIEMQADELVSAFVFGGELFVTVGVVRSVRPDGDNVQVALDVIRSRGPRDPVLEGALFKPLGKSPTPHDFSGPVLSPAARKLLAGMPASFTLLDGVPGNRFVQEVCGASAPRIAFAVSLLGQATFYDSPGTETTVTPVQDAALTEHGVHITLKKGKPVDLQLPVPEKDVAMRGDRAWAASPVKFPSRRAKDCPP